MTLDDLKKLVELDEEDLKLGSTLDQKINEIWKTSKDVASYSHFESAISLGLHVGLSDIPFERAMVFSWIKEEINGRKNRV